MPRFMKCSPVETMAPMMTRREVILPWETSQRQKRAQEVLSSAKRGAKRGSGA
jgi:hypothetical protein